MSIGSLTALVEKNRVQAAAISVVKLDYRPAADTRSEKSECAPKAWAVTLHRDINSLRDEWIAFEDVADCTVFQTFEWLAAYQLYVGERRGETACIAIARQQGGAIALIVPLAIRRSGFVRELTFLGSDLCDYNAPLVAPGFVEAAGEAGFEAIWRDIMAQLQAAPAARIDMVRLEKMPAFIGQQKNPFAAYLPTSLNPSGSWGTPLAETWDAFYAAKRSSSTRSRDRSKRKRIEESGQISFQTPDTASGIVQVLNVLMTQKAAALSARGIRNIFEIPGYADFYREVATDPRFSRFVHVSTLDVGEDVAAVNFGLNFRGRYYYVLSSYTGGPLAKLGPGTVHLHQLMQRAIDRGLTYFDFTIGDEPYKRDWCDSVQPLYDHVSTLSWSGAMVGMALQTARRIKRTIKQNPTLWNAFTKVRSLVARTKADAGP